MIYPTLLCNTGLGDLYVLLGAMVYLAKKHGGLRIPALPQYIRIVRKCLIFHPEIVPFEILNDAAMLKEYRDAKHVIRCHWTSIAQSEKDTHKGISWDHWQYKVLGVPFDERWNSCPLEKAASIETQIIFPGPYYLVHEDPERGFPILYPPWHPVITTRRVATYGKYSPLSWCEAIRQAKELHFIDSSMWHLAESITIRSNIPQPKYLHRYVRPFHSTWHAIETRYHWQYIDGTPTPYIDPENLTDVKKWDNDTAEAAEPSRAEAVG